MERRLAAILAADVVGYSRLMEADEAGTLAALKLHCKDLIDPKIAAHSGRMVKLMGAERRVVAKSRPRDEAREPGHSRTAQARDIRAGPRASLNSWGYLLYILDTYCIRLVLPA